MKKECVVCEKEFVPYHNGSQVACGKECQKVNKQRCKAFYYKLHGRRNPCSHTSYRPCVICGNEFVPYLGTPHQKTCGKACQKENIRQYQKAYKRRDQQIAYRTCAICGKEFAPYNNHCSQRTCGETGCQVRCSKASKADYQRRSRAKLLVTRKRSCVICGKEFVLSSNLDGSKTCGDECRLVRKKETSKRYQQLPKYKAMMKTYRQRPEAKERKRELDRLYYRTPDSQKKRKAYNRSPAVKMRQRATRQTPEYKAYNREHARIRKSRINTAQLELEFHAVNIVLMEKQDEQP